MALKIDFDVNGKQEIGYIRFPFTVAAESSDEFFDVLPPYVPYSSNRMSLVLSPNAGSPCTVEQVENELPSYENIFDIESPQMVLPIKN
ncbi:hypothetical protein K7432_016958 [Basidiobolus ranarum]|uniref:Uncharacterized protein n=1 Tax=Basidiobolus ranarum TaxID=34480 RepID=A0ABR2WE36_9FUNG